mmetsp:Transcript_16440/g.30998  ORF Transcript_16440/g.30998 Transcript_16440/m.30998 type:complete len:155 (-) Transcript_16440:55-519(-)
MTTAKCAERRPPPGPRIATCSRRLRRAQVCVAKLQTFGSISVPEVEVETCDVSNENVVAVQSARTACQEILCGVARSGEWHGSTPKKGKGAPWPSMHLSDFDGWHGYFEKKCSPMLVDVGDYKYLPTYDGREEGMAGPFFDKTACGCSSRSACE